MWARCPNGVNRYTCEMSAEGPLFPVSDQSQARPQRPPGQRDDRSTYEPLLSPKRTFVAQAGSGTAASSAFVGILTNAFCWSLESR
jgi:hypothetical protein